MFVCYSSDNGRWEAEHAEASTANDEQFLCRGLCINDTQMEQVECGECGRKREGDDKEERG